MLELDIELYARYRKILHRLSVAAFKVILTKVISGTGAKWQ